MWVEEFWGFIEDRCDRKVTAHFEKLRKYRQNRKLAGILSELERGSDQLFQKTYQKHHQNVGYNRETCKRAIFDFLF
jgi:hypothetical protein